MVIYAYVKIVVKRLLEICSSKLKTYDCVATFYLSYGVDEGGTDDKEYKSVDITATYKTMVGLANVNNTADEVKFQTLEKRNNTFSAINTFDSTAIFNDNVNINSNLYKQKINMYKQI